MRRNKRIGGYLRRERVSRSITVSQIARTMGVSHTAVSMVERDCRPPSYAILTGYSRALEIDIDTLCVAAGQIPHDLLEQLTATPETLKRVRRFLENKLQGPIDMDLFKRHDEDIQLIQELLDAGGLRPQQQEDMEDILDRLHSERIIALTDRQRSYVKSLRREAGLDDDESGSIFSSLPPEEQARQRAAAAKIVLPWERKGDEN